MVSFILDRMDMDMDKWYLGYGISGNLDILGMTGEPFINEAWWRGLTLPKSQARYRAVTNMDKYVIELEVPQIHSKCLMFFRVSDNLRTNVPSGLKKDIQRKHKVTHNMYNNFHTGSVSLIPNKNTISQYISHQNPRCTKILLAETIKFSTSDNSKFHTIMPLAACWIPC